MSEIQIEKGVPLKEDGRGRPRKYPLRDMEVGDSFALDGPALQSIRARCCDFAKANPGYKFAVRKTGPDSCRVWRIA